MLSLCSQYWEWQNLLCSRSHFVSRFCKHSNKKQNMFYLWHPGNTKPQGPNALLKLHRLCHTFKLSLGGIIISNIKNALKCMWRRNTDPSHHLAYQLTSRLWFGDLISLIVGSLSHEQCQKYTSSIHRINQFIICFVSLFNLFCPKRKAYGN